MCYSQGQIDRGWSRLSPMQRFVASRVLNHRKTLSEIAAEATVQKGTVAQHWDRAKRILEAA